MSGIHVVLFQPEIPPNTGNIMRLCVNTGASLHLIEPIGFTADDTKLRRAGLDYHDWTRVHRHVDVTAFLESATPNRLFTVSTHNPTTYTEPDYVLGDAFMFGPESRGLPPRLRNAVPLKQRITLPMAPNNRSLNLANTVAVVVYEAWRQLDFCGAR